MRNSLLSILLSTACATTATGQADGKQLLESKSDHRSAPVILRELATMDPTEQIRAFQALGAMQRQASFVFPVLVNHVRLVHATALPHLLRAIGNLAPDANSDIRRLPDIQPFSMAGYGSKFFIVEGTKLAGQTNARLRQRVRYE